MREERRRFLVGSSPDPSPCGLWFTDNGHITVRRRPGDVHSLALSNRGLRVGRRYVYNPAVIGGRAIVVSLGGKGGNGKANQKSDYEKIVSHWTDLSFVKEIQPARAGRPMRWASASVDAPLLLNLTQVLVARERHPAHSPYIDGGVRWLPFCSCLCWVS